MSHLLERGTRGNKRRTGRAALLVSALLLTCFIISVSGATVAGASTLSLPVLQNPTPITPITNPPLILAPAAPSNLIISTNNQDPILTLMWSKNDSKATQFKIERKTAGSGYTQIAVIAATQTMYIDKGLSPGTTYTYRVRASNAGGDSGYSNEATNTVPGAQTPNPATSLPKATIPGSEIPTVPNLVTPVPNPLVVLVPAAPSNLVISTNNQDPILTLMWSKNDSKATQFKIERKTAGSGYTQIAVIAATQTEYLDKGLSPGTTYTYRVRASNTGGDSGYSNEATNTVPGAQAPNPVTVPPTASTAPGTIFLQLGSHTMTVNGTTREIDPGQGTQGTTPAIRYSRVFLPIRAILEAMGGNVAWDGTKQQVTITSGATTIILLIGQENAQVNGQAKTLDVAPYISDTGRTMLPLRFIAENLGCQVRWNGTDQSVTITFNAGAGTAGNRSVTGDTGIAIPPGQPSGLPSPQQLNLPL